MATLHKDPNVTPAMPAPPGQHSQLVNPPQQTLPTILLLVFAIALSAPFVALRMYTRRYITRKLWWDDCKYLTLTLSIYLWILICFKGTCMLGWVFLVVLAGLMIKGLDYGLGTDLWNVSKANHVRFTKVSSQFMLRSVVRLLHNPTSYSTTSRLSHE